MFWKLEYFLPCMKCLNTYHKIFLRENSPNSERKKDPLVFMLSTSVISNFLWGMVEGQVQRVLGGGERVTGDFDQSGAYQSFTPPRKPLLPVRGERFVVSPTFFRYGRFFTYLSPLLGVFRIQHRHWDIQNFINKCCSTYLNRTRCLSQINNGP